MSRSRFARSHSGVSTIRSTIRSRETINTNSMARYSNATRPAKTQVTMQETLTVTGTGVLVVIASYAGGAPPGG
jgi:hypothetical protein